MGKFRFKLTGLFVLMIVVSVVAAGLLMQRSFRDMHLDTLRNHMVRELRMLLEAAPWPAEDDAAAQRAYLQEKAAAFRDLAGMRVTYIRADGTVVGDSDHDPATMDPHLDREEVQEALAGEIGTSVRYSDSLGENMVYVAMAVRDGGGKTVGFVRLAVSLGEIERSMARMWLALGSGLLLLILAAAAVSYRVARGVTRPLERMTDAAKRMAAMDYGIRVPDGARDEVGELGRALNAMASSLQQTMAEIRQNEARLQAVLDNMTSGVVMISGDGTITVFNRRAEQLLGVDAGRHVGRSYTGLRQHDELVQWIRRGLENREACREELTVYFPEERLLEVHLVPLDMREGMHPGVLTVLQDVTAIRRLEKMRSEFVANVSHELKTPVAAVKGFAETLLSGAATDPETARSFLTIIHEESERLNRLISDLLDLSKIESRRLQPRFSPVELKPFLARQLDVISAEAARKNIRLELEAEDGLILEADEDRLGQIVLNLLQNGVNYTPENGRVKVSAFYVSPDGESGEERVRLIVADTGIGIPKKDLPRIFERFYRVDKARSRSSGGTGLGLSIVKHLVEMHRGSIRVESAVGAGSRFIIDLPVLQP
jgi:two-component system phosphate regulon sensor histidine kinase PhoR